jgi:GT2 family glycosyltransferase
MEAQAEDRQEAHQAGRGLAQAAGVERGLVACVARNNLHLTKLAIKSALAQDYPCDVLLIDNASTDGTSAWAGTKPIAYVQTRNQESLAACWNFALKLKGHREHVLIMNNDAEIHSSTYRLLLAHGGPFVTCVSVNSVTQLHGQQGTETDYVKELRAGERPHPDFSCFLIRRSVVEKVGLFDEDCWPAYTEDSRYHVRMHRAGVRAVCIDLPFLHHGASTLKNASEAEKIQIEHGAHKNRERFKELYGCYPGTPEYEELFL